MPARVAAAGVTWQPLDAERDDPAPLLRMLEEYGNPPHVVLDGYCFGPEYQKAIQHAGVRLMVVDDLVHHERYHCDALLNQNLGSYNYNAPGASLLLGPSYALLRLEFTRSLPAPRNFGSARRILVTMGGSDPGSATERVLDALRDLPSSLQLDVVLGPAADASSLDRQRAAWPVGGPRIQLHADVRDMRALEEQADIVVASAGSTAWELAYLGVPMILLTLVENQTAIAECLGAVGAALTLGSLDRLPPMALAEAVADLARDLKAREAMSLRARAFVDGGGAERVCAVIAGWDAA